MNKQVGSAHYAFARYLSKPRWISLWHQLDEVARLDPHSVLEVGPGPGTFKRVASLIGIKVRTLDLDPELKPDLVGSAMALPFGDDTFDVVCAFQMLEHLPYDQSLRAFAEMARVSRAHVVISLPDARVLWPYKIYVPFVGEINVPVIRPSFRPVEHVFDGEHYWEINKRGYGLKRVVADLSKYAKLVRTYRVPENTYHRFFVFCCGNGQSSQ